MKKLKNFSFALSAFLSMVCITIGFSSCNDHEVHIHEWSEWTTMVEETCTTKGLEVRICNLDASHSEQRFIESRHLLVDHDGQAPTCTELGWNEYQTCSRCDYTTYETVPTIAHNFVDGICTCEAADYQKFLLFELNEDRQSYSVGFWGEESFAEVAKWLEENGENMTEEEILAFLYSVMPVLKSPIPLIIPATYNNLPVTAIRKLGFAYSSFKSVTIPNSVTDIGENAFRGCLTLKNLVLGDGVTSIGDYAFAWCNSVTSIEIPDSVTSIGESAFFYCGSLTSVVIGDSVTSIGSNTFGLCDSLTSVYYKDSESGWSKISIENNATHLINATIYYYSETKPTASGTYWYYDENGNIAIW